MFPIARPMLFGLLPVLGLVVLLGAHPAAANDQTCDHLISAPGLSTAGITITTGGTFCLATDIIMATRFKSGNAITIAANYVTLDLNGHKVHGANAGAATGAIGIYALNRRAVTVKNGTVWGFNVGIELVASAPSSPAGYLVEGVRAELNREIGIWVRGANGVIRNSVIANTGPTAIPGTHFAVGIFVESQGGHALYNDVLTATGVGGAASFGIQIQSAADVLIAGNRITSANYGVYFSASTGKYRDNLTSGITIQAFFGGTNAGNNN